MRVFQSYDCKQNEGKGFSALYAFRKAVTASAAGTV